MGWIDGKRGAWRARWREGGKHGTQHTSHTFVNQIDAEDWLRAKEKELLEKEQERRGARSDDTIEALVKRYGQSRAAEGRARPDYIAESSATLLAMAKEMEWTRLTHVTASSIDAWRCKREGGKGTDKPFAMIRAFLAWAKSRGLRIDPTALDIRGRKRLALRIPPLLDTDQASLILQRAERFGAQYLAMIEHLMLYGCRPIDACRLLVKDWLPSQNAITYRNTKNGEDVIHEVHPTHGDRLTKICAERKPDEPLFLHRNQAWIIKGGRATQFTSWYKANIGNPLVKLGFIAKEQKGAYCLKDKAITTMLHVSGGDRKAVVAISGHKTLSVVDRYLASNKAEQSRMISLVPMPLIKPGPPTE